MRRFWFVNHSFPCSAWERNSATLCVAEVPTDVAFHASATDAERPEIAFPRRAWERDEDGFSSDMRRFRLQFLDRLDHLLIVPLRLDVRPDFADHAFGVN